jgi:integrase
MFNFAISRDLLDTTPVAMVKPPAKENQRERILSPEEIRVFWKGIDEGLISPEICLALKLQLVTAQRKGEWVGAALSEFDLEEEKVWIIPAERVKNGRAHRVPLSPLAVSLIKEARALAGDSEWLFPSPRGNIPVRPEAVNQALYRACVPISERSKSDRLSKKPVFSLSDIVPHDLRRTAASNMAALGINRLVISKILNHVETNVTAIYDRHGYNAEKRHALEAWAAHLEGNQTRRLDQLPEHREVSLSRVEAGAWGLN